MKAVLLLVESAAVWRRHRAEHEAVEIADASRHAAQRR
jgi:hypothetical protein